MPPPKKDTSILSILTSIAIFMGILYLACCGDRGGMIKRGENSVEFDGEKSQSLMLAASTPIDEVLKLLIYAPYNRTTLSDGARSAYGHLGNKGVAEMGEYTSYYLDLQSDFGRVRVNDMASSAENSYMQTIELHPFGDYYIGEVINEKYLKDVTPMAGEWELSLYPADDSWHLSFIMDSAFVKYIIDTTTTMERRK